MDKVRIDADLLTAKDMRRARVALGGRDPWELLRGEQEDRAVLIAWCQLSRDNPDLTWDEVDGANFGTYVEVDEGEEDADRPSPEPRSSTNGSGPEKTAKTTSAAAASKSPSSAASTT